MKTVLITGGSSGIGAATASLAAREGWNVVIGYHRGKQRAAELLQALQKNGGHGMILNLPLEKTEQISSIVSELTNKVQTLEAIVMSASPSPQFESFLRPGSDPYTSLWNVNVWGHHVLLAKIWKHYFEQSGGHVIGLLSSALGPPVKPQLTAYVAVKSAMKAMLESAYQELGASGLNVTLVSPDFTQTPMLSNFHDHILQMAKAKMPGQKFLDPQQVAQFVVHALNHPSLEPGINLVSVPTHD